MFRQLGRLARFRAVGLPAGHGQATAEPPKPVEPWAPARVATPAPTHMVLVWVVGSTRQALLQLSGLSLRLFLVQRLVLHALHQLAD